MAESLSSGYVYPLDSDSGSQSGSQSAETSLDSDFYLVESEELGPGLNVWHAWLPANYQCSMKEMFKPICRENWQ